MADILLTVGLDLTSLKTALGQVSTIVKQQKFPEIEKAIPIDAKQLSDTKKFTAELSKEFAKLGTAIGKGEITNISNAFKAVEDTGKAAGFSSVNLRKLAETSKFYDLQAKSQGRTLAGVRAELSTYNRALSSGQVTIGQVGHRIGELTAEHKKLAAEHEKSMQQGFLSPKSLARMALWAIGWTVMYGAMRLVTSSIANVIKGWLDFENAMARAATVTRQVGMEQKAVMGAMSFAALDYSRKTTVAATDVAKVMYHLGSAGLNASEQMGGFEHVLALTIGTLGNVDQVSRLVASSYILFGDSITQATTISEKFQYISDVLGKIYAEHQVELSEIASAFTYVGGAASIINIKFEELVGTIGFLNDGMLKGSKAGTSLMATFVALGSKADTLREYFGITWDISKPIDFLGVLQQMKTSIGDTTTSTIVFSQLMQVFGTRGARAIVQILQRWNDFQDAIKMTATDIEGAAKKMQEIIESTVGGELIQLKNQIQAIATTILETFSPQLIKMLQNINKEMGKIDLIELSKKWGIIVIDIISAIYSFTRNTIIAINLLAKTTVDSLLTIQEVISAITLPITWMLPLTKKAINPFKDLSEQMQKTLDFLNRMPTGDEKAKEAKEALIKVLNDTASAYENLRKSEEKQSESAAAGFAIAPWLSPKEQIATLEKMHSAVEKAMIERINLEGMAAEEFSRQVDLLDAIQKKINDIKAIEQTYVDLVAKVGSELSRNYEVELLKARGFNEVIIKQKELNNLVEKYVEELKKTHPELSASQVQIDAMSMSFENLSEKYRGIFSPEILAKFKKGVQDITLVLEEEIKSFADEIESKTVDFMKNLMAGTADAKEFFQSIVDVYRETFAQKIVQMFGETTGIFAGMAAAFMSPLQRAHYGGVQSAVPLIIQAHIDGISQGMAGAQVAAPTAAGGMSGLIQSLTKATGGIMTGFMQNISDIFKFQKAPPAPGTAEALKGLPAAAQQRGSLQAAAKAIGQTLGGIAAVYGGVQGIMAQKGVGAGMGALGGALSGAMAGFMLGGPLGAAIGGVIGAIGGLFMGKKKAAAPPPEIRQQTLEIKSAIQISNKELQLINRNITGMRRDWEGYIMPRAAYFAERMGVEERFNLSRSRGIL